MRNPALVIGAVVVWGIWTAGCVDTTQTPEHNLPATTQPAATAAPTYQASLVDSLYESTAGARAAAAGDINGDGVMDFASISAESQRVQIHLQRGTTGEFDTYAIAGGAPISNPTAVEVADLNSDGKLDVIVLASDTGFANDDQPIGTLVMLFQGADPTKATNWTQIPSPGATPPSNLTFPAGDGVEDGPTEMLVGNIDPFLGPDVVVLANGGDDYNDVRLYSNPSGATAMNYAAWQSVLIEADFPTLSGGDLGDLDGDGDLDVIVNVPEGKSYNLRWIENPSVSPAASTVSNFPIYSADQYGSLFETTARATALALGDINGDGATDVASIAGSYQPVQVHLWNETNQAYDTVSITSGPPVTDVADLALTDVDADGKLDIVLLVADTGLYADQTHAALVLLFQGADATVPANWTVVPGAIGLFPVSMELGNGVVTDLTIGDVDGANGVDIMTAGEGAVRLFANPGGANARDAGNWQSSVIEPSVADQARAELVDLDSDGDQDVVIADHGGSGFNVRWVANPLIRPAGQQVFDTPTYLSDLVRPDLIDPLFESTAGAKAVAIGDINNDGAIDVASVSDENQTVQIHLMNTATGMFDPAISIAGGGPLARMNDIELVDFNVDGRLDVAVLINDTGFAPPKDSSADRVGGVAVLVQGADPTDPALWTRVDFTTDTRAGVLRAFYFLNNESGMVDMVTGDFTGDSLPDIVVASNEDWPDPPYTFVYLLSNPGIGFVSSATQWSKRIIDADNPNYGRLDVGDIDLDGDLDVVASVPESKTYNVRWLQNSNNGWTWTTRFLAQQQGGGEVLALGDIDADGDQDLAVSSADMKLTQWFRNPGAAALSTGAQVPWEVFNIGELPDVPGQINQVRLVDLDGDNDLDAFVTVYDDASEVGTIVGFQRRNNVEESWELFQIDSTEAVYGRVAFADFDGNGRRDFLAPLDYTGLTDDRIAFYTQVTDARWVRGVVGQQEDGANYMSIGDINGDGNPDVAVASTSLGLIQWLQNPGPAMLDPAGAQVPWKLFTVGEAASIGGGAISQLQLVDLDGDGLLECFVTADGTLAAYFQGGTPQQSWTGVAIDQTGAAPGRIAFTALDNDGYLDFLVPLDRQGTADDQIAAYTILDENRWRRRMIGQQPGSNGLVAAADIDGDGHLDVASVAGDLTQWYRNPGPEVLADRTIQVPWDVFNIGTLEAGSPDQMQLIDLESNGVVQCFVSAGGKGWRFEPQSNIEDYWTPSRMFGTDPLADVGRVAFADFNSDGLLDVVLPLDRVNTLLEDQFILLTRLSD